MVNFWKKAGLIVGLSLVTLALVVGSCAPAVKPPAEKTVKVGVNMCLTGPIASSAAPLSWGALNYLRYVNDELGGVKYQTAGGETQTAGLHIAWEENAYNVAKAISIYKRQQAAGAQVMFNISGSMSTGLLGFLERDRIPIVHATGALPIMIGKPPIYITSYFPSFADNFKGVMKAIRAQWTGARPPRVGSIAVESPEARAGMTDPTIAEYAKSIGVEYVGNEWVPFAVTDSTIELTRLKAKNPDYIYIYHVSGMAVVIVKDATRLGLRETTQLISSVYSTDESLIELAPGEVEGMYAAAYAVPAAEEVPGSELAKRVMQKYGAESSCFAQAGMVSTMVLCEGLRVALEKVGYENLTGPDINDSIQTLDSFDVGGLCPPITVKSRDYPVMNTYLKLYQAKGGKLEPVGEWVECPLTLPSG